MIIAFRRLSSRSLVTTSTTIHGLARVDRGAVVQVRGWVRSVRRHKDLCFIVVNDGSDLNGVQVVCPGGSAAELTTGAAVSIAGTLSMCPSTRHNSDREVLAENVHILGACDASAYPVQKKHHTNVHLIVAIVIMIIDVDITVIITTTTLSSALAVLSKHPLQEFLRKIQHLRGRTTKFAATMRIRSSCASAVHDYFNGHGYRWIHAPILTASDCEGGGEQFRVVTDHEATGVDHAPGQFFNTKAYLTVSAQLHAEMFSCSMGPVYTFGPAFRSEKSQTSRHLAEFWMVEPEIPFATLDSLMDVAEDLVKTVARRCAGDDLDYVLSEKEAMISAVETCTRADFARIAYEDAIKILQNCPFVHEFTHSPSWGADLQTEHEQYLVGRHFKRPVFVTSYPIGLKPFYTKASSTTTCAAMDLLVPSVGELIGGSERIDDVDELAASMDRRGLDRSRLDWYLDLRRFGSVPHGGFGLGFDRLVQFLTGTANIRDVVPVPRVPGHCPY